MRVPRAIHPGKEDAAHGRNGPKDVGVARRLCPRVCCHVLMLQVTPHTCSSVSVRLDVTRGFWEVSMHHCHSQDSYSESRSIQNWNRHRRVGSRGTLARVSCAYRGRQPCDGLPYIEFSPIVLGVRFIEPRHLVEAAPLHEATLRKAARVRTAQKAASVCPNR
jgi:hypothetical protein